MNPPNRANVPSKLPAQTQRSPSRSSGTDGYPWLARTDTAKPRPAESTAGRDHAHPMRLNAAAVPTSRFALAWRAQPGRIDPPALFSLIHPAIHPLDPVRMPTRSRRTGSAKDANNATCRMPKTMA